MDMRRPLWILLALVAVLPASAEQTTDPPEPKGLWLPAFVDHADWKPMTGAERRDFFVEQAVLSPVVYLRSFGSAVFNHTSNRPPEWGQGAEGYFHRVGDRFGRFAVQDVITHGTAAALGHEVRYVRCECKGLFPRVAQAIAQNFVALNSQGNWAPNYARVAGTFGSEIAGNYWWPERTRNSSIIFRGVAIQFGVNTGLNLFREFTPEVKRIFKRR